MEPSHFRFWPPQLARNLTLPRTSLWYNIEVSARRYPDKPFIHYYGTALSYGQAHAQAEALAGHLQAVCGVARGDRVLLYLQNSPQFILGYYAILRCDAVVVPVNPMNLLDELRHQASDSGARVIVSGQELHAQVAPLLAQGTLTHAVVACYGDYVTEPTDLDLPPVVAQPRLAPGDAGAITWHDAVAAARVPGPHRAGPDDLCVMPYTSGTTGRPKGCMHTHASAMATAIITNAWSEATGPDTTILGCLPLFHVTGMQSGMNQAIALGATVVLMTRWDRVTAARLIERHRVQAWTSITTMAIDFLSNPELERFDLSSLRRIGGGGAAMPGPVATRLQQITGLDYMEGYGLSETIGATHINPPGRPKKQCLGIPVCNTESLVVDPDSLAPLPPGEVGEIVSRGPQVFQGYWNDPAATAAAFVDIGGRRFFRTGDLARTDEDGYVFLVDRLKRMINAAGFKVWPAEVESLLYGHPAVQEACVIASRDARRGETVKALVVLRAERRGKVQPAEVVAWCREHMAAYKVPRVVEFVDALPRSGTGKVQWRLLQERELAGTDAARPA